jgi:hypothetical protein
MNKLIIYIKAMSFRLKWTFMSPCDKYGCLWGKTKKLGNLGSYFQIIEVDRQT